jgi:hypothetical protein
MASVSFVTPLTGDARTQRLNHMKKNHVSIA